MENDLGIPKIKSKNFIEFWDKYEQEICSGREVDTLIPLIEREFNLKFPIGYSLLIEGFVKRFEANKSIWSTVNKIRKTNRIGLLTNIYPHMFKEIKNRDLLPKVTWDVIIDSSIVGVVKPDESIFRLAEKLTGSKGNEILFVDNSIRHIESASKLKWKTFLYNSSDYDDSSRKLSEFYTVMKSTD